MSSLARLCDIFLVARNIIDRIATEDPLSLLPVPIKTTVLPEVQDNMGEGYMVRLLPKDWHSTQFESALFRYEDHADIYYSHSSNLCWRRFAVCKESAHLLIDDHSRNHFTTDVASLISGLITSAPTLEVDSPVESETMGVIAAIEILLPWRARASMVELQKDHTDLQIAEKCRVPEKFVNAVLKTPYANLSKRVNAELDGK